MNKERDSIKLYQLSLLQDIKELSIIFMYSERYDVRLPLWEQKAVSSQVVFHQRWSLITDNLLPEVVSHHMWSTIRGSLSSQIIFYQVVSHHMWSNIRWSLITDHLLPEVVSHHSWSIIIGGLSSEVVSHMWSFITGGFSSQVVSHQVYQCWQLNWSILHNQFSQ